MSQENTPTPNAPKASSLVKFFLILSPLLGIAGILVYYIMVLPENPCNEGSWFDLLSLILCFFPIVAGLVGLFATLIAILTEEDLIFMLIGTTLNITIVILYYFVLLSLRFCLQIL